MSMESQTSSAIVTRSYAPAALGRGWMRWWSQLSLLQKIFPAACALTLWGGIALLGGFRSDHLNIGIAILALGYLGPQARKALRFITPLLLTGVVYDTQRYYSDFIRGRIRVEEP